MAINIVVQGDMKDELTGQCLELIRQVRQKNRMSIEPMCSQTRVAKTH